jgi:hypothetical protein
MVRADEQLRPVRSPIKSVISPTSPPQQIFNADSVPFQKLPEIVNRFLTAPDPILLHYTINPALVPSERPSAWDVEIKTEDVPLKSRITVMLQSSKDSAQDLSKLDEEVSVIPQHSLRQKNHLPPGARRSPSTHSRCTTRTSSARSYSLLHVTLRGSSTCGSSRSLAISRACLGVGRVKAGPSVQRTSAGASSSSCRGWKRR